MRAACGTFQYTSPLTNYTYYLNNCGNNTFDVSQANCNSLGGHLVSYQTSDEQQDAEGYYTSLGEHRGGCSGLGSEQGNQQVSTLQHAKLLASTAHPCLHTLAGALLPRFHQFYWIGIRAVDDIWPAFRWIDSSPGPNRTGTYQHWGYYMPQNIIEPNNFFGREYCVGANATERWNVSWGWADFKCDRPSSYMCRQSREWA